MFLFCLLNLSWLAWLTHETDDLSPQRFWLNINTNEDHEWQKNVRNNQWFFEFTQNKSLWRNCRISLDTFLSSGLSIHSFKNMSLLYLCFFFVTFSIWRTILKVNDWIWSMFGTFLNINSVNSTIYCYRSLSEFISFIISEFCMFYFLSATVLFPCFHTLLFSFV